MAGSASGGKDPSAKVMGGVVRFPNQRVPLFIQSAGPDIGNFFQAGNGPRIANVHVVPIFWGTAWDDSRNPNPSVTQVIVALSGMLGGPYFDGLAQYGVGPGQLYLARATRSTTSDPPSNPTSNDEIQTFLSNAFAGEALPTPDATTLGANPAVSQFLYVVFLPPGWTNRDGPAGEHTFFDYNGTRTYYAWVTHGGGIDNITAVFLARARRICFRSGRNRHHLRRRGLRRRRRMVRDRRRLPGLCGPVERNLGRGVLVATGPRLRHPDRGAAFDRSLVGHRGRDNRGGFFPPQLPRRRDRC